MTVDEYMALARQCLAQVADSPRLEARLLAEHVLGVKDTWLIAHGRHALEPAAQAQLQALLARRAAGTPMAYLTGRRAFYGRDFRVSPDTLIPRPETEHLVEAALERCAKARPLRVLDVGTGTGCIAITLSLECPLWQVTGVDISPAALAVAGENARLLGAKVDLALSDLFSGLQDQRFHIIVSNPPYVAEDDPHLARGDVRHEPRSALVSGPRGMDTLAALVAQAPSHLEAQGWLIMEHGHDQAEAVASCLQDRGFREHFLVRDLAGLPRITGGRFMG